jgi:hypothetical protein
MLLMSYPGMTEDAVDLFGRGADELNPVDDSGVAFQAGASELLISQISV